MWLSTIFFQNSMEKYVQYLGYFFSLMKKHQKIIFFIVKKIAAQKRTTFWSFCTGFFGIFFNLFWQCLYKGINFWLSNYIKIHDKVNYNEFVPTFPKIKLSNRTIIQYRIRTLFFKNICIRVYYLLAFKGN